MNVGPCHHGMARPRVADGGTASNMKGAVNKLNNLYMLVLAIEKLKD